jgi:hypothetical protein
MTTMRVCPFCGTTFELASARIAKTVLDNVLEAIPGGQQAISEAVEPATDQEDDDADDPWGLAGRAYQPAQPLLATVPADSGEDARDEPPLQRVRAAETLWEPPVPETAVNAGSQSKWARVQDVIDGFSARTGTSELKLLTDFKVEDMPRRLCPSCEVPLPAGADRAPMQILAIAGLNSVGKTHYLVASLDEAIEDGLEEIGCTRLAPDGPTDRFLRPRINKFLHKGRRLQRNNIASDVRYQALTFSTVVRNHACVLLTHDIAGESILDDGLRSQQAPFLRRASGMIFLVDPLEFRSLRGKRPEYEPETDRSASQANVLQLCLDEMHQVPGGKDVPVAIVVSKSDLLSEMLGRSFGFDKDSVRGPGWLDNIKANSAEVRELLLELGERRLVEAADRHGSVSYHAVSPMGSSPYLPDFRPAPRRCLEPLAFVLSRMAREATHGA